MMRSILVSLTMVILATTARAQDKQTPVATPPPAPPEQTGPAVLVPEEKPVHPHKWYFGGTVGVYSGGHLDLPTSSGWGSSQKIFEKVQGALKIGFEAAWMGEHTWGVNFGIEGETNRKIENAAESDINARGSGGESSLKIGSVYGNAIYRWSKWYLPFGINLTSIRVGDPSPELVDLKSLPGFQAAAGYFFASHFSAEAGIRIIPLTADYNYNSSANTTTNSGSLSEASLALKGYF